MANVYGSAWSTRPSNVFYHQEVLFSLISRLCAPPARQDRGATAGGRLIVDGRLPWAFEPVDGRASWLYLPEPARVCEVAGCLVVSAD